MKRSRELKPLSSEHHHALLIAFQLKKGLAGHSEAAGAPRDLPGLLAHARKFEEQVLRPHARAEEELLGRFLLAADVARLHADHAELTRRIESARDGGPLEARVHLAAFADLLERHVRWEERELFPFAEANVDAASLARIGAELEKRLVLARSDGRAARR